MSYIPTFKTHEFHKPSQHYEVDINGGTLLIAKIRKNASTALKIFHQNENSKIIKAKQRNSKNYSHKVFFYRDPLARFISIFLNKFVDNSCTENIKKNFLKLAPMSIETMKFTDYVEYSKNDFSQLDCHFRPQKSHLWEIEYDSPINTNNLQDSMSRLIGQRKSYVYFSKKINKSHGGAQLIDDLLIDKNITKLRELKNHGYTLLPSNFISPDIETYVKQRYSVDYKMITDIQSRIS